jgi:hypothetical protein
MEVLPLYRYFRKTNRYDDIEMPKLEISRN